MPITKHTAVHHSEQSKRLAAAVTSVLIKTLRNIGSFTVFAPTSQAFAAMQDDIDTLLKPENKSQFTKVLMCHIIAGKLTADTLKHDQELTSVAGDKLKVCLIGDKIIVGGATLTYPDVAASNGIIHVIDKVMTPLLVTTRHVSIHPV